MRRKLKTLRAKQGHSQNGAPRQMIDEMIYREHGAHSYAQKNNIPPRLYDSQYSGWGHATRPRDQSISVRRHFATATGISAPSGPT